MSPQPDPVPGSGRQQAREQRRAVPLAPVRGVDDELAAHVAALRLVVGFVQMRVAEQVVVVGGELDIDRARPAAVPDLQEHVLAEGGDAVRDGRGGGQRQDLVGSLGGERALGDARAGAEGPVTGRPGSPRPTGASRRCRGPPARP